MSGVRVGVMIAGVCLAAAGVALLGRLASVAPAIQLMVFGLVLAVGTAFERWVYKPVETTVPAGWIDTGERTVQDSATVAIYYRPDTGQRRYVRLD